MCVANEPARFRRNQEIQLEKLGFFKPYAVITQREKSPVTTTYSEITCNLMQAHLHSVNGKLPTCYLL